MSKSHAMLAVCIALMATGSSHAIPTTVTGSGVLTAFPGFGYQYSATWDSTAGSSVFSPTVGSSLQGVSGNVVTFSAGFKPTGGQSLDVESFSFSASVEFSIVRLSTGLPELPSTLHFPTSSAGGGLSSTPGGTVELRFSNPVITFARAITDPNGVPVANGVLQTSATVDLSLSTHFDAGHFAMVSADPGCAAVACMPVGHDVLLLAATGPAFSYSIVQSAVPEPQTAALMLTGMGLLVAWARRRRA